MDGPQRGRNPCARNPKFFKRTPEEQGASEVHRARQFQLHVEAACCVQSRRALRDLVAARVLQSVGDRLGSSGERANVSRLVHTDAPNPTLDAHLLAGAIHLSVVEDVPAKVVNLVAPGPTRHAVPLVALLRQERRVRAAPRDEKALDGFVSRRQQYARETVRAARRARARARQPHLDAFERLPVPKRRGPAD